ncbi:hypothetical protein BP6252_13926 [Coleophoma cylindrospora]|uniref:N-acetyltransferase domain-containing protein n=1 Tax=Coleophoma cylindrospora TaxID=1849047 RepID=A0A3D8Q5T6_9HELO|nr:hypothetical protein BP6252_13926 [Coleophoma cylindrospora]
MTLIVQPAAKENALQRGEVQMASNAHDPLMKSFLPDAPYDVQVKFFGEATSMDLEKPGFRSLEVIDTESDGKVVAFAQWKYPTPSNGMEKLGFEEMGFPDGTNIPFTENVFTLYNGLMKKYYDPDTMYYLAYMYVLPAYQRRGLGQRLMEQALLDADKDGAKSFVCASEQGRGMYAKRGFKELETVLVDFIHLGAVGARNTTAMIREPSQV